MSSGIEAQVLQPYKYGFVTDIESETVPPGLSEDVIRLISQKKGEPAWMLEWRLKAYRNWQKMPEPHWANVQYGPVDYQAISYYAAPKQRPKLDSLDQVDPKLLETFEKLGIPLEERKRLAGVAVDPVFDSVSVATTFREELKKHGVIFCAISEAIREYPDLVPRRRRGAGRDLQLRDQARRLPRPGLHDLVDPGGDRLRDHLEVSRLHPAGRRFDRRVLLRGRDQPAAAGGHGHQDDPHGQEHALDYRVEGDLGGPRPEHLPRAREDPQGRGAGPQLLAVRLDADRGPVRCAHVSLHRRAQQHRHYGARGLDVQDRRGPDLLRQAARSLRRRRRVDDRERLLQGSLQGAPDGVRGRSAAAARDQPRRERGLTGKGKRITGKVLLRGL